MPGYVQLCAGVLVSSHTATYPLPVAPPEVDLFSAVQALVRKKLQIIAVTALCGLGAVVYAYTVKPEYEVGTALWPAGLKDLDAINRSQVYSLSAGEALRRLGASLDSYETRLEYFRTNPQLQEAFVTPGRTQEQGFEDFNRHALKVVQPDPKRLDLLTSYVGLEMRYPQGVNGTQVLNGLVQFAIDRERNQISEDLQTIINNRVREVDAQLAVARLDYDAGKRTRLAELREADVLQRAQLNDELRALRVQLKLSRDSRIAQLNEAIDIARSLGLSKPSTPSSISQERGEAGGNIVRTEITNQQIPLYFMGTEALEAERRALSKRTSDDFVEPRVAQIRKDLMLLEQNRLAQQLQERSNDDLFVKGTEALRAERLRLTSLNTDMSSLRLVNIDRPAVEPTIPVYPRKSLFVLTGLMLGGIISVMFVLARYAFKTGSRNRMRTIELPASVVVDSSPASRLSVN
ncbi:TPA: chain-length determining protein [Pseudomonas putida]|nr:chain-length determining protein [Pseudomonas putida]